MAAFTNTNANPSENDLCRQINVDGTQNILDLCRKYNKYLIHISTDFVFDGTKTGIYTETDSVSPVNGDVYAQTKAQAEKLVLDSRLPFAIIRIAYPYRSNF